MDSTRFEEGMKIGIALMIMKYLEKKAPGVRVRKMKFKLNTNEKGMVHMDSPIIIFDNVVKDILTAYTDLEAFPLRYMKVSLSF